jgi:hypothetical protein
VTSLAIEKYEAAFEIRYGEMLPTKLTYRLLLQPVISNNNSESQ